MRVSIATIPTDVLHNLLPLRVCECPLGGVTSLSLLHLVRHILQSQDFLNICCRTLPLELLLTVSQARSPAVVKPCCNSVATASLTAFTQKASNLASSGADMTAAQGFRVPAPCAELAEPKWLRKDERS
eukprot:1856051-Amphidinium_carterae.1